MDQELSAVGFYISGHPLERQLASLQSRNLRLVWTYITEALLIAGDVIRMAGVLHKRQERISGRTGKRFAYLNLSDPTGEYEVIYWRRHFGGQS